MLESWLTFTASVGLIPAATFVMRRSLPGAPTDTVLGALATEPEPRATEFDAVADAPVPNAAELVPLATVLSPNAAPPFDANAPEPTATEPVAIALVPMAIEFTPVAWLERPIAIAPVCVACALSPSAVEDAPLAIVRRPSAVLMSPLASLPTPKAELERPAAPAADAGRGRILAGREARRAKRRGVGGERLCVISADRRCVGAAGESDEADRQGRGTARLDAEADRDAGVPTGCRECAERLGIVAACRRGGAEGRGCRFGSRCPRADRCALKGA